MEMKNSFKFIKDYGLLLFILVGPIVGFIIMIVLKPEISTTLKQVHWHMPISYDICGDTSQLKDSGNHGTVHGHDGGKIHIEGIIDNEERKETLGDFFDSANILFSSTNIGKYKNGDSCDGSNKVGKLSVLVNGKENFDFREYILNDKDDIKIIFK